MGVKTKWTFSLRSEVKIEITGSTGVVVGRAHYLDANPSYLVRYKAPDGSFNEDWLAESALASAAGASIEPDAEEE